MEIKGWSVERDKLLPVLQTLDLVPSRPAVPSSNYLMLEGKDGKVQMAASAEICGRVWVTGEGSWPFPKQAYFVDRRLFLPFLFASKDIKSKAPFQFYKQGESLVVQQGRRKAVFETATAVSGYGAKPDTSGIALQFDKGLSLAVRCARESATTDTSVPHLNCVYLIPRAGRVDVMATNQIIMQQSTPSSKLALTKPLPFPLYLVDLVNHDDLKKVIWAKKELILEFGHGVIWQTVSAIASKDFPSKAIYDRMTAGKEMPEMFRLDCHKLGIVVARLAVYLGAVRRIDWFLSIKGIVGGTDLTLEAKVPQGVFREKIACGKLKSVIDAEWPLDNLLPVFEYIGKEEAGDLVVRYEDKEAMVKTKSGGQKLVLRRSPYHLETKHLKLVVARLVKQ